MRKAQTTAELHPIILERWSTRAFDASYEISEQELVTILEAARWAASANNMQPWRFAVATRGDELFAKFSESLAGFNKSWAPNASALIAVMFEKTNEKGEVRASAPFDTGLAVGQLVLQAQAIELHTHQIGGFDKEALLVALQYSAFRSGLAASWPDCLASLNKMHSQYLHPIGFMPS